MAEPTEPKPEVVTQVFITEKIKARYEQIKVLTATLLAIGAGTFSAYSEVAFGKDWQNFKNITYMVISMGGLIAFGVIFFTILSKIDETDTLINKLK